MTRCFRRCSPFLTLFFIVLLSVCSPSGVESLIEFVDPFIGTDGHGHTYPGATLPFGMVQLSPDTRLEGWDGASGYHYSDDTIYGFSHTHLSGTGYSDYGDILLMPTVGDVRILRGSPGDTASGYASKFSHDREEASPGYYRVWLEDDGIGVELTVTLRAGFHRYIFPRTEKANIICDLTHRDPVIQSSLNVVSDTEIEGMRRSSLWAEDQRIHFVARFSKAFVNSGIAVDDELKNGLDQADGTSIKAFFQFRTEESEQILVKVGISAVSIEGARKNLEAEIEGWDFEGTKEEAGTIWEAALDKIAVTGKNREHKTIFYTALYHSMLCPNLFMDVDGSYRGADQKNYRVDHFVNYTMFSLWDTFRAVHPLLTIIDPKKSVDFIQSLLAHYRNGGMLPKWELAGNETGAKIGYPAAPVIVDAYMKGIRDFDAQKAFDAMVHSADSDQQGLSEYKKKGYIPSDNEAESVSKSLEYAYDDWCIAQMAKARGNEPEYERFIRRAQFYKNLFDPTTGFMRPKRGGFWYEPFDPLEVDFNYTEANAWQYTFFVPHDVEGLIKLMGGKIKFSEKLDELFDTPARIRGKELADITGQIGMYAHGNEPSHHLAYLFNYVLQPWKTQQKVREIMNTLYSTKPDGLCGNEDCGQLSAWYVLSALGFYPVCPGQDIYVIGTPLFPEASISVGKGRRFVITAKRLSPYNVYIQEAKLNGEALNRAYIKHSDIASGGEMVIVLGGKPNRDWAAKSAVTPPSAVTEYPIVAVPFIKTGESVFKESTVVVLETVSRNANIYYTTDGTEPTLRSNVYSAPFVLNETTTIRMFAYQKGLPRSYTATARFEKISSGPSR
jgi:predicted alpha-1,2-mannosidase